MTHFIVVDGAPLMRDMIERDFARDASFKGDKLTVAGTTVQAIEALKQGDVDIIVSAYSYPFDGEARQDLRASGGLFLLGHVTENYPNIGFAFCSGKDPVQINTAMSNFHLTLPKDQIFDGLYVPPLAAMKEMKAKYTPASIPTAEAKSTFETADLD